MLSSSKAPLGKRKQNAIRNRHSILVAARACFQKNGYENTTIRDIINETDLASGTFYNYFRNKQDIFAALLTDFLSGLNENLTQHRRSASTAEEFIYRSYQALYQVTARDPLVFELAHRNERALKELFGSGILRLIMMSLEDDVRDAIDRKILPDVDQDYLCAAFFGVGYETSLVLAERMHKHPELDAGEIETTTRFSTDLFIGGLSRLTPLPCP
ncbi:TetR/AcrR family transcriptional regulator [Marinobacter sp. F3R11]|uniref:TetR/AcrR family transcriptional regulator n=1 Tax=Marinobacter sp. F3R11 TaxID=2267231 RepID=UPI0016518FD4|nr:TetR/AcrR family transcriptional regulator [Marinobacter sp. F3R11]